MCLQTVGSFLRNRRKFVALFLICSVVGLAISSVLALPSYAATDIGRLIEPAFWLELLATIILAIAGLFIRLTVFILSFVITLGGYNGYLDSAAVNVGWVMVRDITNMVFVVILLIIAFGTILGLEQYEWKKLLGKFIFAAILVNFSRTICGLIIDVAQVVMTTFVNGIAATAGGNLINAFQLNQILELSAGTSPTKFTATEQFIAAVGGVTFAAMVMGVMFVFLYMLLARMVVLWVLIVLSPLAFVLSILPQTESYAGKWWSEFTANVITGPVLLFFVWLSFVTLGNGNISQDISDNSTAPNRLEGSAGTDGIGSAVQAAGISAIMSWPKMASFAIAIGMLMVGAKAAEELGGAGASAVGGAIDFGKTVGKYASGINAARWAGGHAVDAGTAAAKFAAMKAPVIGGENWVNMGKNIASISRAGWAALGKKRSDWSKGAEDWARGKKGLAGVGASVAAFAFKKIPLIGESSRRKAKKVEDWQDTAENYEKIEEETFGTSKLLGGRAKLRSGVLKHAVEKMAEKKKDEKYAKKEAEMIEKKDAAFMDFEHTAITAQANAEEIKKKLDRAEELQVAEAKDKNLTDNNQTPRYKEQVLAKHTKEDIDLAGSSDFDRTMQKVAFLRDQIRAQRTAVAGLSPSDTNFEKEQGKLKNLITDMASLQAFNGSRGSMFGDNGTLTALIDASGNSLKHDADADDVAAHQANELASILQRQVGKSKPEIDAALEELRQNLGKNFGSFMQSFTAGLAFSADDGAVNKAGLFKEDFNVKTGESNFHAADMSDVNGDAKWHGGKREWSVAQSKATKIQGFGGSVDNAVVNGQVKISISSDAAQDRIANMFGNVTANIVSSIDKTNIEDFNDAFANMAKDKIESLLSKMLAKAKDPAGLETLFKRTKLKEIYAQKGGTDHYVDPQGRRIEL